LPVEVKHTVLEDNPTFGEEKQLIEDALEHHVCQLGPNTHLCQLCGNYRTAWSPYCEDHMKSFTKQYKNKPSSSGVLEMVKKLRSQDMQMEDSQRAMLAEMHGRGADRELEVDVSEGKRNRTRPQTSFVLDKADETFSDLDEHSFGSIHGDPKRRKKENRKKENPLKDLDGDLGFQTKASLSTLDEPSVSVSEHLSEDEALGEGLQHHFRKNTPHFIHSKM